jgi:hypothetical protein
MSDINGYMQLNAGRMHLWRPLITFLRSFICFFLLLTIMYRGSPISDEVFDALSMLASKT